MKWMILFFNRGGTDGGFGFGFCFFGADGQEFADFVGEICAGKPVPVSMAARRALMVFGPVAFKTPCPSMRVQKRFSRPDGKVVADGYSYVAEVDVDGAGFDAAVAHWCSGRRCP